MMTNYEIKIAEMKKSLEHSSLNEELELKKIANKKLDEIYEDLQAIVGKPVWEDFNFRTGRILGILRFIAQNPKQRKDLLKATNLRQEYVDMYYRVAGNLPFVDTRNQLSLGRPMHVQQTRDLVKLVGIQLGVYIDENDLFDITEERWKKLYDNALERALETQEHNRISAEPDGGYDE